MAKKESEKAWNSTLPRRKKAMSRTPLRRSQFLRTKSPRSHENWRNSAKSTKKPKTGLANCCKKHKKALKKKYFPVHRIFLSLKENRFCWICLGRSMGATRTEIREIMLKPHEESSRMLMACQARCTPATEVHHWAGRIGRLLDFVPYFIPQCLGCREWPHVNLRDSRALDLVASATAYNVFPRDREGEIWEEYKSHSSFESKKNVDESNGLR